MHKYCIEKYLLKHSTCPNCKESWNGKENYESNSTSQKTSSSLDEQYRSSERNEFEADGNRSSISSGDEMEVYRENRRLSPPNREQEDSETDEDISMPGPSSNHKRSRKM